MTRYWSKNIAQTFPKDTTAVFTLRNPLQNSPRSHQCFLDTFCIRICCQELSKIAQSGHTSPTKLLFQVIGLEILSYYDVTSTESFLVFYPQIHVDITRTLKVQLGLGFMFNKHGFVPQFAYRVINESPTFD